MTMIPASYERRPPSGSTPDTVTPPPVSAHHRQPPAATPAGARAELPGWVRASLFAAVLLAVTWLAMLVKSRAL